MNGSTETVLVSLHAEFFLRFLKYAPSRGFTTFEPIRPSIVFFMISGLDIVEALDTLSPEDKSNICDWIYTQQVTPRPGFKDDAEELKKCGFYGSRTLSMDNDGGVNLSEYNVGHLAMTYSCLCTLVILGDDLSRLDRVSILKALEYLQNDNGSFLSSVVSGDNDMRFVYCAVAVCYILDDFSSINVPKVVDFIVQSAHYDGGIGLKPGLESHGGSSFCGIASLSLMGRLKSAFTSNQMNRLIRWLLLRQVEDFPRRPEQVGGFQGRPHKEPDTCYSFWIGASLQILDMLPLISWEKNKKSILACQKDFFGGFSKYSTTEADLLHTYFSLYGLSLMGEDGLRETHPALTMSRRASQHLKELHESWKASTNS